MHFTASVIEGWQNNLTSQFSVTNACNNKTLQDRTIQYGGTPDYDTLRAKSCLIFVENETIYRTKDLFFFSFPNATTCSYELSWFPSWLWRQCSRLLRLGRPWGPTTLSQWCVSGDMQEDEIPGGALSLNLLTAQTMVTTGIFPCKEKFPR